MIQHPVVYRVIPPEGARQRLSVAFRLILAIPHILLVGGPGISLGQAARTGVLGAVADICAFINWFAIVFTGRAIQGLMDLQIFYLKWRARALAYEALLRDEYPPFGDGDYPVTTEFLAVREGRNRWTVGFRLILIIPQVLVLLVLLVAWFLTAVVGWFAILFIGHYPEGLWRFGEGVMRWTLRLEAYMLLLHDQYPPFSLQEETPQPAPAPV
ncbi:MAG TPA: DUF4389 domain-containing protein [Dehalococcoidia bacterium]|nr:DUF4389 domain-containing protein [Dehalococcoidia bacterium]